MGLIDVDEYRPNRNFLRVGDPVTCDPLVGNDFEAVVRRIRADEETGEVKEIEVVGAQGKSSSRVRTLRPERVSRRAKTKAGEPVDRS